MSMRKQEDQESPPLISGFAFASPSASTPATGDAGAQAERVRAISAVAEVTGCEPDVAKLLLEANQWQVEAAVAQFLDSCMGQGAGGGGSEGAEVKGLPASTPVRSHRRTYPEAPECRHTHADAPACARPWCARPGSKVAPLL